MMRALRITLCGMLLVSAVGFMHLRRPLVLPKAVPEFNLVICEKPLESFQSLETPIQEKKKLTPPTLRQAVVPVAVVVQVPVQTIEERGDAMLFEAEALSFLPFDQAVVMPFD